MTLMLAVLAQSNCASIPHNYVLLERCLGSKIAALIIATTTSDIVKIPTRPGNNSCDTRKVTQKHGSKITMDQTAAVGKVLVKRVMSVSEAQRQTQRISRSSQVR